MFILFLGVVIRFDTSLPMPDRSTKNSTYEHVTPCKSIVLLSRDMDGHHNFCHDLLVPVPKRKYLYHQKRTSKSPNSTSFDRHQYHQLNDPGLKGIPVKEISWRLVTSCTVHHWPEHFTQILSASVVSKMPRLATRTCGFGDVELVTRVTGGTPEENHRKMMVSWELLVFNPLVMTAT